jgi:hypothetical protein
MGITITEALAEIATIDKRIAKKSQDMVPYVSRPDQMRDPLEKSGGSAKYIAEERQSFSDLLARKIELRRLIAEANAKSELTVGGVTRSVADWLVWKRECYDKEASLLRSLIQNAQGGRQQVRNTMGQTVEVDFIVNIDEKQAIEELDALEDTFGKLDGLLSLKNATTVI